MKLHVISDAEYASQRPLRSYESRAQRTSANARGVLESHYVHDHDEFCGDDGLAVWCLLCHAILVIGASRMRAVFEETPDLAW